MAKTSEAAIVPDDEQHRESVDLARALRDQCAGKSKGVIFPALAAVLARAVWERDAADAESVIDKVAESAKDCLRYKGRAGNKVH
jgi:hypothetical protein